MNRDATDVEDALLRVQAAFPRIYLACHSRHQNARTTAEKLSQRDASLLAHLDDQEPVPQARLAAHMGVAKSTLSEALSSLEKQGLVVRQQDGRGALIRRTAKGIEAMSNGSVLEAERLRRILRKMTAAERKAAVAGLELIARASERTK